MPEYHVVIPDEAYSVIEWLQDELPGVGVVNTSLCNFEPKIVFAWHLSIMLQLQGLAQRGMPTREERAIVDSYGDCLGECLKGDHEKPNGLFLSRLTWNGTRELIFRIHDPELADEFLKREIESREFRRPFDYRMDHDPDWALAKWHLNTEKK